MEISDSEFERALELVDEKVCSIFDITLTRIGNINVPWENLGDNDRLYIPTVAEMWGNPGVDLDVYSFASLPEGKAAISFPTYHGEPGYFVDSLIELGITTGFGIENHSAVFDKKSLNDFMRKNNGEKIKPFFEGYIKRYNISYPIVIQSNTGIY